MYLELEQITYTTLQKKQKVTIKVTTTTNKAKHQVTRNVRRD